MDADEEEDAAEETEEERCVLVCFVSTTAKKTQKHFSPQSVQGEGGLPKYVYDQTDQFMLGKVVDPKTLSFDEASRCLSTLGKDESGSRYAYLMMTVTDRYLTSLFLV